MFTGIVEGQGTVQSLRPEGPGVELAIAPPREMLSASNGTRVGESIAINGCCLTIIANRDGCWSFQAGAETLSRTSLGRLRTGDSVNLERCVPAGGRLDGHVVQGHVDGVGELLEREALGNWDRFRFGVPATLARYIAEKGSIAVDGVSLTVTAVSPAADPEPWFEVGLIPTTLEETGLGVKPVGAKVNLEVDVFARYVARLMECRQ